MMTKWKERLRIEEKYKRVLLIASRLHGNRKGDTVKINRPVEYQRKAV